MSLHWKSSLTLGLTVALLTLFLPAQVPAQGKSAATKPPAGKKIGFSGDPAQKRGLEIGYDMGRKAGKQDLEMSLKPDPKRHEAFNSPEKYFRHEYGSQAKFVGGFRSGFMGGYQAAFGKKVPFSPTGSTLPGEKPKTTGSTGRKPSSGASSDAL